MNHFRKLFAITALVPTLSVGVIGLSAMPTLAQKTAPVSQTVDINSASQADLEALPGIGAKAAQEIIKGRPFKDMNDLTARVKGIKAKNVAKLTPLVTFGAVTASSAASTTTSSSNATSNANPSATSPSTGKGSVTAKAADAKIAALKQSGKIINVNSASAADLQLLPLVGDKIAADIIKNRPYADLNDLVKKVKGIGPKNSAVLAPFISFK